MKHDILIPEKLIIDTKYKHWQAQGDAKAGISQADMYQVTSYCFKRNVDKGLLLYPALSTQDESDELVSFKIVSDGAGRCIDIYAGELDITESESGNFRINQEVKFRRLLKKLSVFTAAT